MKKAFSILLSGALAVTLFACTPKPDNEPEYTETIPETTIAAAPTPTEAPILPTEEESRHAARMEAYRNVLEQFVLHLQTPDGEAIPFDNGFGDITNNQFAIADVDGDGEQELILLMTTAPTAGQQAWVYGWDSETGTVYTKLNAYPYLEFYTGGLVKQMWSHNQGLAGENFWPYTLAGYNPAARSYEVIAQVDAWTKSYRSKDYEGNPFPADIDTEDVGTVYLVTIGEETQVMNQADFFSWLESLFGSSEPISLAFQNTTTAHISALTE